MSILELFGEPEKPEPVTSTVVVDGFTRHAARSFDYEFDGTVSFQPWAVPNEIPNEYTIGAIVGQSGSGKSLFLKNFGEPSKVEWDRDRAVVSHFETPEDATDRLSSVGFNSIPSWLKPYHVLSLGEAYRANLARSMGEGAVFDEFTSVVDRDTARSCARSLKRVATKKGWSKIVVATCHEDVLPWLQPDWVFNTNTGELSVGRWLRRPSIEITVHRCRPDVWSLFSQHHYLSREISKASHCYVGLWEGKPVAFGSVLAFPHAVVKKGWRGHRVVVLPEHQGFGIGPRFYESIAQQYIDKGGRFFSRAAHPSMGLYCEASPKWKATSHSRQQRLDMKDTKAERDPYNAWRHDTDRVCWAHEYVG